MSDFALLDSLLLLFWIMVLMISIYVIADALMTAWPLIKRLVRGEEHPGRITITWKSGTGE